MKDKFTEQYFLYQIQIKKDPEAFAKLYDLYVEKIYRFIYLKVSSREEAEDITSEVFLKTWNYLIQGSNLPLKSFSGFLYQIARNAVVDVYRKRARTHEISIDQISSSSVSVLNNTVEKIEAQELLENIKKLKNEYQELLILRYVDGLAMSEIAKIIGKSSVSVRVTIHRAIKVLKKFTEDQTR